MWLPHIGINMWDNPLNLSCVSARVENSTPAHLITFSWHEHGCAYNAGLINHHAQLLTSWHPCYVPHLCWKRMRGDQLIPNTVREQLQIKSGPTGASRSCSVCGEEQHQKRHIWLIGTWNCVHNYLLDAPAGETHPVLKGLRQRELDGRIFLAAVLFSKLSALSAVHSLNIGKIIECETYGLLLKEYFHFHGLPS